MNATATTEYLVTELSAPPACEGHLVPDVLAPHLRLVLIGTAPSRISAAAGAFYANPQNKFWRVLFEVGLTPRLLAPREFPALLELGIGLTDVAKKHSGVDASLPAEAWEPKEVRARIAFYQPRVVAFTSKRGASQVFGRPTGKFGYGVQPDTLEGAEVWVLPSTSPLAHNYFQLLPWQALSERLRQLELDQS